MKLLPLVLLFKQGLCEIKVLQGESEMSYRNHNLGTFQLQGIPPAPRGVPQVEVTFDIDANGIVNVSAKDLGTGKEQQMTITGGTALSKDEIDRMMKEAEAHADEDKERKEEIELRNNSDQLVWQTEKLLNDQGSNVNDSEKESITKALDELKDVLGKQDSAKEEITSKHEALIAASQEFSQRIYSQAQEKEASANDEGASKDGDVSEAEVVDEGEVVDDNSSSMDEESSVSEEAEKVDSNVSKDQ